jgi:hypothetical protein
MSGLAVVLMALVSGGGRVDLAVPGPGDVAVGALDGALTEVALRAHPAETPWTPPACIGDTCQPVVSVPGYEPRIDVRGKRTEFFVSTLERLDAGLVAVVARSMATAGVRLEFTPAQAQAPVPGRTGAGRVELVVRWRLDAWHAPHWLFPAAR